METRITRAPARRVHVNRPQDWGSAAGTDFWAVFGDLTLVPTDSSDLDLYGWVEAGTWVHLAGSAADLLSSADVGTTGGAHIDTAGDAIRSPFIFGDYAHARMVEGILGYTPTELNMECYARFNADPGDDEDTGFGFVEAGAATPFVKAGLMAFITSDGTNFSLESGAAAAAGDDADDTAAHLWRIQFTSSAINWYVDGTLQTNTLALQTDLFPVAWGASVGAGGTGDPVINWVHIWYA
jgi:hypothetical protein